tara:strand:- start:325 stop:663 length:339 start_codon:yes stop_codon:yes gene_type:complete
MTKLNPGLKVKQPLWLTFKNSKLVLKVFEKYFYKKGRRKPKVCKTCNTVDYKVLRKMLVRQMNVIEDLAHSLHRVEKQYDRLQEDRNRILDNLHDYQLKEQIRLNGGSHESH